MYESTPREMLDMNIEELCAMARRNNWDMETLQAWSVFKIAQYLERIAYGKVDE